MSVYICALFQLRECLIPECVEVCVCVFFLFRLMQSGEVSASTAAGYQITVCVTSVVCCFSDCLFPTVEFLIYSTTVCLCSAA